MSESPSVEVGPTCQDQLRLATDISNRDYAGRETLPTTRDYPYYSVHKKSLFFMGCMRILDRCMPQQWLEDVPHDAIELDERIQQQVRSTSAYCLARSG